MNFNWCYFPLEIDGVAAGIQNPLPDFVQQNGSPWALGNGWFNGNGVDTSIVTPWTTDPALFDGVALPGNGSYMIGFQVELGAPSSNPIDGQETLLFCGHASNGGAVDGIRIAYRTNGRISFTFKNRNTATASVSSIDVSNGLHNVFCYVDHRTAGTGTDTAFAHVYQDLTDIKTTSFIRDLSAVGSIYPQQIASATALIIGAMQWNGAALSGSHFLGKIRRLHFMRFGDTADADPSNLAELMGELSKASMIPTEGVLQLMGFPPAVTSRAFVQYVGRDA